MATTCLSGSLSVIRSPSPRALRKGVSPAPALI
jgi:hypothetical protein